MSRILADWYRNDIIKGLTMEEYETDKITIRLESGTFGKLSFTCYKEGRRLSAFSTDIPEALRSIARKSCSYENLETSLATFFKDNMDSIQIEVKIRGEMRRLRWHPECPYLLKTKIERRYDDFLVDRVVLKDNQEVPQIYAVGEGYIADISNGFLTMMPEDHEAWNLWEQIDVNPQKRQKTVIVPFVEAVSDPKTVSLDRLNTEFSEGVHDIFLESLWLPNATQVDRGEGDYVLEFKPEDDGYALSFLLVTGLDYIPLHTVISKTIDSLPRPLRDPVRSRLLLTKFFDLSMEDASAIDGLQPVTLKPLTARENKQFVEWKTTLWTYFSRIEPTLVATTSGVVSLKRDLKKEHQIWELLIKELPLVFDQFLEHGSLLLTHSQFSDSFERLKSAINELGGSVRMNDKPIEFQDWTISLDVQPEDENYGLNAEIFREGEKITQIDWDTLIRTQGIFEFEDRVEVIPPKTLEAIQKLLGKVDKKEGTDTSGGGYLEIPKLEILEWLQLSAYGITVNLPEEDKKLFARLIGEEPTEPVVLSEKFEGTLRPYQEEAYQWLAFLYQHRLGACLADDMGLGKTIQALAFLTSLEDGSIPSLSGEAAAHLIVVPPSLVYNWESELRTFAPHLKTRLVINQQSIHVDGDEAVIVSTYECVRRNLDWFLERTFDVIVFDEAQLVKNLTAARTHAVRQVKGRFKLALTGTPMENHLGEYYAIMDLVVTGLLGSFSVFQQQTKLGQVDDLLRRTKPFILRRTKETILDELPEKTEVVSQLPLSVSQKQAYQAILEEVQKTVKVAFETQTENKAKLLALTAILRLRQLCVHPGLIDDSNVESSPKETYLVQQLRALIDEGHHALVFTQFQKFVKIMEKSLAEAEIPYLKMDGTTTVKKRKELVERFQTSEEPLIFIMTLKTGGVGLNLTRASYVFHVDPWWNPAVEEQASDRIYRIGQTKNVMITRLVMHNSIEEKMMVLKERKKALFDNVMKQGVKDKASAGLTREEISYLISDTEEIDF